MSSNEQLLIDYAKNRMALKAVKKAIHWLGVTSESGWLDLSDYRSMWFEFHCEDDTWRGWAYALNDLHNDENISHEDMAFAVLLDDKKQIGAECGTIRRQIYARGAKLFRDSLGD